MLMYAYYLLLWIGPNKTTNETKTQLRQTEVRRERARSAEESKPDTKFIADYA